MTVEIKQIKAEFAYAPHGRDLEGQWVFRAVVRGDDTQIIVEAQPSFVRDHLTQEFLDAINIALKQVR